MAEQIERLDDIFFELQTADGYMIYDKKSDHEIQAPSVEMMDLVRQALREYPALKAKLVLIRSKWQSYEKYLRAKYPAPEGEEWDWTCEFHRAIAEALREAS